MCEILALPDDTLFEEGDEGESLYLICSRNIAISTAERRLAVLGRNACLGEMAWVCCLPRSATAIAPDQGHLLRIGSDDFTSLLPIEPEISVALLETRAPAPARGSASRAHRPVNTGVEAWQCPKSGL